MAYENGNSLYNYFYYALKSYSKDKEVFSKTLNTLKTINPSQLKYRYAEIHELFKLMLGTSFSTFTNEGNYIAEELENRIQLELELISESEYKLGPWWDRDNVFEVLYSDFPYMTPLDESTIISLTNKYPESMLEDFEREISYFYKSIKEYIEYSYYTNKSLKSIINIKAYCDVETNSPKSILMKRNDGNTFEFELDNDDLEYIIETFVRLKNETY